VAGSTPHTSGHCELLLPCQPVGRHRGAPRRGRCSSGFGDIKEFRKRDRWVGFNLLGATGGSVPCSWTLPLATNGESGDRTDDPLTPPSYGRRTTLFKSAALKSLYICEQLIVLYDIFGFFTSYVFFRPTNRSFNLFYDGGPGLR